jgi:hypothetical protein
MRVSWKGLFLAPLLVPIVASVVMAPLLNGEGPIVLPFFLVLIPACIFSYGTTIFLFLPVLFLLSLLRPVTRWMAYALGFALGSVTIVPVTVLAWGASGPDSGPPTQNLVAFFVRWAFDPFMLVFPLAGLVTAAAYWWLGTQDQARAAALAATKD